MDAHIRGLPSEPNRSIFRPRPRSCRLQGRCDVRAAAKGHVRGNISPFEAASGRLTSLPIVRGLSFVWSRRIILIRNVRLERFVDVPDVVPVAAPLNKSAKPLDFFERFRHVVRNELTPGAWAAGNYRRNPATPATV